MIKKFNYKMPLEPLIWGIVGSVCSAFALIMWEFDASDYFSLAELLILVVYTLVSLGVVIIYIKRGGWGYIVVSDALIELPVFVGKPERISFKDIRYVTETNPGDGLLKISTTKGFSRIEKKFMKSEDFEELKHFLKLKEQS